MESEREERREGWGWKEIETKGERNGQRKRGMESKRERGTQGELNEILLLLSQQRSFNPHSHTAI